MSSPVFYFEGISTTENTLLENENKSGTPGEFPGPGYEQNVKLDNTAISSHFSELTKNSNSIQKFSISERKRSFLEELKAKHEVIRIRCSKCGYTHEVVLRCKRWRLCEYCKFREAMRLRSVYLKKVNSVPKQNLRLVTLTLPNTENLSKSTLKKIRKYLIALLRSKEYSKKIVGGLYSIETLNKGKGKGWHTHLHLLVEVINMDILRGHKEGEKHSLDEEKLSKNWYRITGRTGKIVNIKSAYSPGGALGYLLKYLSKAPFLGAKEEYLINVSSYLSTLFNSRTLSTFGSWYSLCEEKEKHHFLCPNCGSYSWISEFDKERYNERNYYNSRSP